MMKHILEVGYDALCAKIKPLVKKAKHLSSLSSNNKPSMYIVSTIYETLEEKLAEKLLPAKRQV